jgi:hypothetical protein
VFWDERVNQWSDEGMSMDLGASRAGVTVCRSYHLSRFSGERVGRLVMGERGLRAIPLGLGSWSMYC